MRYPFVFVINISTALNVTKTKDKAESLTLQSLSDVVERPTTP